MGLQGRWPERESAEKHPRLTMNMNAIGKSPFVCVIVLVWALSAQAQLPAPEFGKKGVGLAESRGQGAQQLAALNVSWYYNWGPTTALTTPVRFVPMIFRTTEVDDATVGNLGDYVLGYNEPDNPSQSDIPVQDALAGWAAVAAKAKFVGSPATAHDAATSHWLHEFMDASPKVDFVTVHWYGGVEAEHFIKELKEIHDAYGKPLWVTEYAPQTVRSSATDPHRYSQEQVDAFMAKTIHWMDATPWVKHYAWHNSRTGTSALFDDTGALTATGMAYAAAQ